MPGIRRWRSDEHDRLYRTAEVDPDPAQRSAQFIRLNDPVVGNGHMTPLGLRKAVSAAASKPMMPKVARGGTMATLADWYRGHEAGRAPVGAATRPGPRLMIKVAAPAG